MKLTKKQSKELSILMWFCDYDKSVSETDIEMFFDMSDKGKNKELAADLIAQRTFEPRGFKILLVAKMRRDLQVKQWKEDWGDASMGITPYDFVHEPKEVVEWVSEVLDREIIMLEWYKERVRENRREAYRLEKVIEEKPFNKLMTVSRS